MPLGLIIFDCDGVLVDSETIAIRVGAAALAEFGLSVTPSDIGRYIGFTGAEMYADLERIHGIPIPIEIRKQTSNRLRAAMRDGLLPIPGIADIIGQLGSSMCVASNSGPEYLADALKTTV